jgi:hypothetical protein
MSSAANWAVNTKTGSSGTASGTFTIPYVKAATYTVAATDSTGDYATAPFTVTPPTPTLKLNPTHGRVDSTFDFTISGFPPNEQVEIDNFDLSKSNVNTDSYGDKSGSLTVPSSGRPGTSYAVTAWDSDDHVAVASFTVVDPKIKLVYTQGPAGLKFNFDLTGFMPNTNVYVQFEGTAGSEGVNAKIDPFGVNWNFDQLTVPSATPGTYQVSATDQFGDTAYAPFKITNTPAPNMKLNPTQGPVGSTVDFTLSGFLPNEQVAVTFENKIFGEIKSVVVNTDDNGFKASSFTVPAVGSGPQYYVLAMDSQGNVACAPFTVTGPPPTITVNPTQGPVDSKVAFTLSNFPPDTDIEVNFGFKLSWEPVPMFSITGSTGSFLVPEFPPGTYTVLARDEYWDVATARFNVWLSSSSSATVSDNSATVDNSATIGVSVTVSGSSLPNGAQVTVASTEYGDSQPSNTGTVPVSGAVFYDISLSSSSGALGSDVNAEVTVSNPSFNSSSVTEYYNGNAWVSVASKFFAPDTLSVTIPASALNGTPIVVGIPSHGGSANPLVIDFGSTAFILIVVAVVVVTVSAVALVARKLTRTRSVSKSTNQVEKQSAGYA